MCASCSKICKLLDPLNTWVTYITKPATTETCKAYGEALKPSLKKFWSCINWKDGSKAWQKVAWQGGPQPAGVMLTPP